MFRRSLSCRLIDLVGYGLKRKAQVDAQGLTLETVHGVKLVEIRKIQGDIPGSVRDSYLSTNAVNLVMHVGIAGVAAGIVGDLPTIITGWTDFEHQAFIAGQREVLAQAPIESEMLAWCNIEPLLVSIDLICQSGHNC